MTKKVIIRAKSEEKLNEMMNKAVARGVKIQRNRHVKGSKFPYVAEGYKEGAQ